jgi:hypothetical protein
MTPVIRRKNRAKRGNLRSPHEKRSAVPIYNHGYNVRSTRSERRIPLKDHSVESWETSTEQDSAQTSARRILYSPMNEESQEIRLLTLLPGTGIDPIHSKLSIHPVGDCPKFEALSYYWGDATPRETVTVNGIRIKVSLNLGIALQHLREPGFPRTLWVDALCINQLDVSERNHQVCLMNRVYSTADRVLVWLGAGSRDSDSAMELLEYAATIPTKIGDSDRLPNTNPRMLRSLAGLLLRPWWCRIWVIQEVVLPKSDPVVLCGQKWLAWTDFMKAWARFNYGRIQQSVEGPELSKFKRSNFRRASLDLLRSHHRSFPGGGSLNRILSWSKDSDASDLRDHVYGCLGLLRQNDIRPDYDLSIDSVYLKATKHMLRSGNLPFFSHFSVHRHPRRSRPSWVPDFSNQILDSGDPEVMMAPCFQPPYVLSRQPDFHEKDKILEIQGILFDEIVTYVRLKSYQQLQRQAHELERMMRQAIGLGSPLPPKYQGMVRNGDVANLLLAGTTPKEWFHKWVCSKSESFSCPEGQASFEESNKEAIEESDVAFLVDRYFCITSLGFAGLSVGPVRRGDVIVVIGGECRPIVLRPRGPFYTVIGAIYVAGIEQSKLMDSYNKGLIKEAVFRIR